MPATPPGYTPTPEEIAKVAAEIRKRNDAEMIGKAPGKQKQAATKEIRPARNHRRLTRGI